jgi:ubiquinone/menaquinone biosynthesis C-methylase UbiE
MRSKRPTAQAPVQTAYALGHVKESNDVDNDIRDATYLYLKNDLGLSKELCEDRTATELDRFGPKSIIWHLGSYGIEVRGRSVLDLGAGLGSMSEELVLQGATTFAIEPGEAWASICERRAGRHGGSYTLHRSVGESLPFDNDSMDLVVSNQVLEHVNDPRQVLTEVYRVLKPGGYFYLSCENYLAFKEGHYKIFWLPMLPKSVGSVYLRLRGRDPAFLQESVTYVTFPQVMRWTRELGFHPCIDDRIGKMVGAARGSRGSMMRLVSSLTGGRAGPIAYRLHRTFRFGVFEVFIKAVA